MNFESIIHFFAQSPEALEAILLAGIAIGYISHSIGLALHRFFPAEWSRNLVAEIAIVIVVSSGMILGSMYGIKSLTAFATMP